MKRILAITRDAETPYTDLSVSWFSDQDGDLFADSPDDEGYSRFSIDTLSVGAHTVTVTVTDPDDGIGEHAILINVFEAGLPPSISRLTSDVDDYAISGEPFMLVQKWKMTTRAASRQTGCTVATSACSVAIGPMHPRRRNAARSSSPHAPCGHPAGRG